MQTDQKSLKKYITSYWKKLGLISPKKIPRAKQLPDENFTRSVKKRKQLRKTVNTLGRKNEHSVFKSLGSIY